MEDSGVRKQKSIDQIRAQAARLAREMMLRSGNGTTPTGNAVIRNSRINDIESRYVRNIAQSRRFSNDYKRNGVESARKRGYSQNTYMGYNRG